MLYTNRKSKIANRTSLIVLLALGSWLSAFGSQFELSLALRPGVQTCLTGSEAKGKIGIGGTLDARFGWYAPAGYSSVLVGLQTGVAVGYGTFRVEGTTTDRFTRVDYLGNNIDYTVTGMYTRTSQQLTFEVPLLFALRTLGGWYMNIGPKLLLPLTGKNTTNVKDLTIDAYYSQYDVHVINRLVTGKGPVAPFTLSENKSLLPQFTLLVSLETGYEWELSAGRLGIGVYADVAPWSSYKRSEKPFVAVGAISDPSYPVADVQVNTPDGQMSQCLFLNCGFRIHYVFNLH